MGRTSGSLYFDAAYGWLLPPDIILDSITWWADVIDGNQTIELEDFVMGEPWGGTAHLERIDDAHAKYLERLEGWSDSDAYSKWSASDYQAARNYALYAFPASGGEATPYWSLIAQWWAEEAPAALSSLDEEQFAKIVAALAVSEDASKTYASNRKLGFVPPKPGQYPWRLWLGGAVLAWRLKLK